MSAFKVCGVCEYFIPGSKDVPDYCQAYGDEVDGACEACEAFKTLHAMYIVNSNTVDITTISGHA